MLYLIIGQTLFKLGFSADYYIFTDLFDLFDLYNL
jgi:hypothetical protein